MGSRTVSLSPDSESALSFLAKDKGVTADEIFTDLVNGVIKEAVDEANDKRFDLVAKAIDSKDKSGSIARLKELLG